MNRMLAAALILGLGASGAGGQGLVLDFAPPEVSPPPICQGRAPDAALLAFWGAWDGRTLPEASPGMITRDLRRLAEIDAKAWDPTLQAAYLALSKASAKFTAGDLLLAQIHQRIATGQLKTLAAEGLVQALLDRGDENSPKMQFALAGFLTEGIGIARDPVQGQALLIAAGYGGNADALMALSGASLAGQAPEGWDISPDLAVTMAFGAMVGQMDPQICDRISRIAREFTGGGVVARDAALAMRWYRFAADLGDPQAAWKVAEYHLHSEALTKDNAVLLAYLGQAAEAGLPQAQVTLAAIAETGALMPQDMARALRLYQAAADQGDRTALIRLASLAPDDPAPLARLAALAEPPSWVYAKQAALILKAKGRWAGQAQALALWQKGARALDPTAIRARAQYGFGHAKTEAEFYASADLLIQLVNFGEVAALHDLTEAFLCKAPHARHHRETLLWAAAEAALDAPAPQTTPATLALLAGGDARLLAEVQTEALSGRTGAIALMQALTRDGAQAFWTGLARGQPQVLTARAGLALEGAQGQAERGAALALVQAALDQGDPLAALDLAQALLQPPEADPARARDLLEPLAEAGNGAAMALLLQADPGHYPDAAALYARFAPAIAANGDVQALILALPFLPDAASRATFRARAVEAMSCSFDEALAFAQVWGGLSDMTAARHWLSVAADLAGQDDWRLVRLADAQTALLGPRPEALALYEAASALGSRPAVLRLLKLYGVKGAPGYDPARAASLTLTLVERSDPAAVPGLLADLARRDPVVAAEVDARLDLGTLYRKAAEAGNPQAMREHANRLRIAARSPAEIALATDWLVRASEAGDAKAMVLLSQAYALGVGIPPSPDLAQLWLHRAADAGDTNAMDLIRLLDTQKVQN